MEYNRGVYCYLNIWLLSFYEVDLNLLNECIDYIGKDSHIDKNKRHKDHMSVSHYNKQVFNRILQSYIFDYLYIELHRGLTEDEMNMVEKQYIKNFQPLYCYTSGGDGGYYFSSEIKEKMSAARQKGFSGISNVSLKIQKSKNYNYIYWSFFKRVGGKIICIHAKDINNILLVAQIFSCNIIDYQRFLYCCNIVQPLIDNNDIDAIQSLLNSFD